MPHPLRDIKTFPQLVKYLRDELEWPIDSDNIDDLTFDYDPDELGLDPKNAAKIKPPIKQLRPFRAGQPWGIFFVNFEPKRLPIVALRKMLGGLVFKRRASANKAERAAWNLHDLLFISAFGEGDERQLTLAHFSEGAAKDDIPTLKVLGWDGLDTQLTLQHTERELKEKLAWREGEAVEAWRRRWSSAFTLRPRQVIATAKDLAIRLAELARAVRNQVRQVLEVETDRGPFRKLYAAFQETLIHDLSEDDFADTYAQTVTYGLFSAAVARPPEQGPLISADSLAEMIPETNPFLKELLSTFLTAGGRKDKLDFDEAGIQEVVAVLNSPDTDLGAVGRQFGDRGRGEDPVIHFYEDFLDKYDKPNRQRRGVYYTPQPVVSYIVRSVHELLQTEFGLEDGLASTMTWREFLASQTQSRSLTPSATSGGKDVARRTTGNEDGASTPPQVPQGLRDLPSGTSPDAPFVTILDPATGTATFLVEVIEVIHRTMTDKWRKQKLNAKQIEAAWNEYVPKHLLPRLFGYELMMAPYAIAHMKLGLKLKETGYNFASPERARIYLTNALEPPRDFSDRLEFDAPVLAHEAKAVNEVKRKQRFTVVIGNPPYAGYSANEGEWIEGLMEAYKTNVREEERQIQRLSNDYVKFICFSQFLMSAVPAAVLGFITDRGYLDGILFRDMRSALCSAFHKIHLLDLHGIGLRGADLGNDVDDNVFDITQGVAIGLFVRAEQRQHSRPQYADLFGPRSYKCEILGRDTLADTQWQALSPYAPKWFLVPMAADASYDQWPAFIDRIGTGSPRDDRDERYGTGVKTRHDPFVIGWDGPDALRRVRQIANRRESGASLIRELGLCTTNHFSIEAARKRAAASDLEQHVKTIAYRPFDRRSLVHLREFVCEPKAETMKHMAIRGNLALAVLRRDRKENGAGFFVARGLIAKDMVSNLDDALVWPLYVLNDDGDRLLLKRGSADLPVLANIASSTIKEAQERLQLSWIERGPGNLKASIGPEDLFHYFYGILYSPGYRSRYAEFLKIDFPRLPLTSSLELFRELARLGGELVALHLMESPRLNASITSMIPPPRGARQNPIVESVSYSNNTVWLDKKQTRGFQGVPEEVWNFHIGGYQVCEKWLKDRGPKKGQPGRTLTAADIEHYHRIVVALAETIRLMAEIDRTIDHHGGWPGAFQ